MPVDLCRRGNMEVDAEGPSRFNLLVLCHEYPPVGGGAGAACATLAEEYAAAGHAVTVLTMGFDRLPASESVRGVGIERILCGRKRREMASPWEALRWGEACWRRVQRLHAARPFDAVHSHFIMPAGIVARRLKQRSGVPFVITSHGSDVPGYNRERLRLAHWLARPWWRRICREADAVISPSAILLRMIERTAGDIQGSVIPYAAPLDRFQAGDKQRRILLCSRLVERKGFQHFLRGVADLNLPGWEIDLVGTGPMFERLRTLAAGCRMPVRLHGWIDNRDPRLAELYRRAPIFALPSECENFPVSLLEAMAAECAIVATDVTGNPEVVGKTACLVPPGDVAALRAAVVRLTGDVELCGRMGRLARERAAAKFDPRVIAGTYLSLLASLSSDAMRPLPPLQGGETAPPFSALVREGIALGAREAAP